MWYRDYTLVQQRVEDMEREWRGAAVRGWFIRTAGEHDAHRRDRLRAAAAAGVRRLGRSIVAFSDRIDAQCADAELCGPQARRAFR